MTEVAYGDGGGGGPCCISCYRIMTHRLTLPRLLFPTAAHRGICYQGDGGHVRWGGEGLGLGRMICRFSVVSLWLVAQEKRRRSSGAEALSEGRNGKRGVRLSCS